MPKKTSKKEFKITEITVANYSQSKFLRILACRFCSFSRNEASAVLMQLDFYTSSVDRLLRHLVDINILSQVRQYYYGDWMYSINPDPLYTILSDIDADDFGICLDMARLTINSLPQYELSLIKKANNIDVATLMWRYAHGEEIDTEVADKFLYAVANSNYDSSCYTKFFRWMLGQPRFLQMFLQTSLQTRRDICRLLCYNYTDLDKPDIGLVWHGLFFNDDNEPFDEYFGILYVLHNELFVDGHLDRLIAKYRAPGLMRDYLLAVEALHRHEFSPISEVTAKLCDIYSDEILSVPALATYMLTPVLVDMSTGSFDIARKLQRLKGIKDITPLFQAMLDWKVKHTISEKRRKAIEQSMYSPSSRVFYCLLGIHCKVFSETGLPFYYQEILNWVSKSRLYYIQMLFASERTSLEPLQMSLEAMTGMTSFLVTSKRKELWEEILEEIQGRFGNSQAIKVNSSRVAYLVNTDNMSIQPILQKSTDGGKWSKGRNIALKTFSIGSVEGMTPQDAEVARCVEAYDGWSGTVYTLRPYPALCALAGNPNVMTNDEHRLKIEVTEEPLSISVTRNKDGKYVLQTNVKLDEISSGIYIDNANPTSLRVVKVDSTQLQIITKLSTLGALPAAASKELAKTLKVIGTKMTVMSDLMTDNSDARQIEESPLCVVQLLPDDDSIRVSTFVKPLGNVPPYLTPGAGSEYVSGRIDGKPVVCRRNLSAESDNLKVVTKAMRQWSHRNVEEGVWMLDIEETLSLLQVLQGEQEHAVAEWPEGVRMRVNRPQIAAGDIHVSVRKLKDWFSVEGEIQIDADTAVSIAEVLKQMSERRSRFIRLGDNEYVALSEHLAKVLRSLAQLNDGTEKSPKISPFNASLIDMLGDEGVDIKADRAYRQLIKRIETADKSEIKMPRGINAELREYQKEGYTWLARLDLWGAGACLADDMGLGKTLQSIVLLHAKRAKGAALVIAPTSIQANWQTEITRFSSALNPLMFNHANEQQRIDMVNNAGAGDVVVASYGMLVTQQQLLTSREWSTIVLDEAHTIKNPATKMSKAAMELKGDMRIALTGTPLQNRLSEIWNIFRFLNPGLLGSLKWFADRFIIPIERESDKERQRLLKQILSPFMLRRTKNDVLSELPPKTEIEIKVNLSEQERALYESMRRQAEIELESGETSPIEALAQITRLRQAACDARLVDPELPVSSSKAEVFMQLIDNLIGEDHRALVFSQFTSHLALIRERLDAAGIQYLYLDGSTPAQQRTKLVDEFQTGDTPLFLISLKAGGLGLNLTAADYVIHLDPWWNPAIEDQASDRSYRIGQQKPVTVYRLIATDTIEEKIINLHTHKKSLADALLEGSDMSARLTKEDILNLLSNA